MGSIFHPLGCGKKETFDDAPNLTSPNQPPNSSERVERDLPPPHPITTAHPKPDELGREKSPDKALVSRPPQTANLDPVSPMDDNHSTNTVSKAENVIERLRGLFIFKISKSSKGRGAGNENKVEETIVVGETFFSNLMSSDAVKEGINHLLSGDSQIMSFLDDVSRVHPIAAAVVVAFKTAWRFVKTRQENDKRIIALFVSMSDMVAVFRRLRGISRKKTETNSNQVKRVFGFTLEDVSKAAVEDITECGNMCEIYSKTRATAKVLNSGYWQGEFTKYLKIFAKHRQDFDFALTIHIAGRVEEGVELQHKHSENIAQINEKLNNISSFLEKLASPAEKEIVLFVQNKGGIDGVLQKIKSNDAESDVLLRELNDYEQGKLPLSSHGGSQAAGKLKNQQEAIEDLRKAIQADQDQIIKTNLEVFQRKFDIQQKQFRKELEQVIEKASENIIRTLTAGLHSRILDKDVAEIWKIMKWGGSVKARHFVMALHDYFTEKWGMDEPDSQLKDNLPSFNKLRGKSRAKREDADAWALSYLNPANAQTLSEAFDEDASGFITIKEVNEFIASKPDGWSLLHWIAYWVIGWHHSQGCYRDDIQSLIRKILQCLPSVRRENRSAADDYTETMLSSIVPLVYSLSPIEYDEVMSVKFKVYDKQEEQRLEHTLAEVQYEIDGKDGVKLITGTGQIEKKLFPLLYLLLKRHLDIIRVAEKKVLDPSDLEEARESIRVIMEVVSDRVWRLESIFTQQKLRANEHFQRFANGIFDYVNDPSKFWSTEFLLRIDPSQPSFSAFSNDEEDTKEPDLSVCNHTPSDAPPWTLKDAIRKAYSDEAEAEVSDSKRNDKEADRVETAQVAEFATASVSYSATHDWISKLSRQEWNGFFDGSDVHGQLLSFTFNADNLVRTDGHLDIMLVGSISTPSQEYSISKTCAVVSIDGDITLKSTDDEESFHGNMSAKKQKTITGEMTIRVSPTKATRCTFLLEQRLQDTAYYNQYRPPLLEFQSSRSKALWKFAITAVIAQVSAQKPFARAFWNERKRARERFVDLLTERKLGKTLEDEEWDVYSSLQENLRREDRECYEALVQHKLSSMTRHGGYTCDDCGRTIYGTRTFCLTCIEQNGYNTVDFCDRDDCVTAQETHERDLTTPHLPSHTLLRARRVVFQTMLGRVIRDARSTQKRIKKHMDDASKVSSSATKPHGIDRWTCIFCHDKILPPFWACIDCNSIICVCSKCDEAGKAAIPEDYNTPHNFDEHVLVKWQTTPSSGVTVAATEERLARMESRIAELDASLNRKVDQLLTSLLASTGNGLQLRGPGTLQGISSDFSKMFG